MDTRIAVVAIIIEDMEAVAKVNALLHEYSDVIACRMGLPCRTRNINIINVVLDAPLDKINALAGKLGRLDGVTAKAVYSDSGK